MSSKCFESVPKAASTSSSLLRTAVKLSAALWVAMAGSGSNVPTGSEGVAKGNHSQLDDQLDEVLNLEEQYVQEGRDEGKR